MRATRGLLGMGGWSGKVVGAGGTTTRWLSFDEAQKQLLTLSEAPENDVKLRIYALYKQSTLGACNTKRPGMLDMVGKFKWDAWNDLGSLSKEDAQTQYIQLVEGLIAADSTAAAASTDPTAADAEGRILHQKDGKIFNIILNRPEKKNALTREMYLAIRAGLETAAADEQTAITVISARGDYFSSGNDLGNFMVDMSDIARIAKESNELLLGFVGALIDHPKPLVGLVHGPAIGICVTTLALLDVVYASDRATIHAPFSHLGQSPEGCSSLLFPRIMGPAKAHEFLLFGRKLTAAEAADSGLITSVFPDAAFAEETQRRLAAFAQLPPQSMQLSKRLIRSVMKEQLHAVNKAECDLLEQRWQSKECANAIANFFAAKN